MRTIRLPHLPPLDHASLARGPWRYLVWCILGFGALPRITQFMSGRALWHDESLVVANVVERGFIGLLAPLDYLQVAPPFYLWFMKICIAIGGHTVQAVRFPSVVAGLIALFLGWQVARRLLSPCGALFALALLALSQHLILYSGEAKPYGGDAMFTLLVLYLALKSDETAPDWRRAALSGGLLAVAVWFSYPVVFVIAGVGIAQLVRAALDRNRVVFTQQALCYGISAASFALQYLLIVVPNRAQAGTMEFMQSYWKHGFMPFPPTSFFDLRWFRERAFLFFDMPGGFTLHGLALFAFLAGLVAVYYRKRHFAAFLLMPLGFALIASGLRLYPFHARATLFLTPIIMLAVGEGIALVMSARDRRAALGAGAVMAILLMTQPFVRASRVIVSPTRHHELDRAMDYVDQHWKPGDRVFLARVDEFSYRFLAHRYSIPADAMVFQPPDEGTKQIGPPLEPDLLDQATRGGTVWFPMTYEFEYTVGDLLALLDAHGIRDHDVDFRGASAYRYTFPARTE